MNNNKLTDKILNFIINEALETGYFEIKSGVYLQTGESLNSEDHHFDDETISDIENDSGMVDDLTKDIFENYYDYDQGKLDYGKDNLYITSYEYIEPILTARTGNKDTQLKRLRDTIIKLGEDDVIDFDDFCDGFKPL